MAHTQSTTADIQHGSDTAPNALRNALGALHIRAFNSLATTIIGSAILGALIFIHIYGYQILNITYDDWIRNASGDFAQSYYGWRFFRHSTWHWPIGLMDDVAYPSLTPIMYIDSVPIMNVVFKGLSPLLPATVQFFGIWGLLCFMLNGALGGTLIHRFTGNSAYSILGSVFFSLTTFSIQRLYTHTALAANWIILWGLVLAVYLCGSTSIAHHASHWTLLFFMAISVNMYYVPIIGIIMLMYAVYRSIKDHDWKLPLVTFGSSMAGAITAFYLYGGFYHMGSTTVAAAGLGELGANLNSLINPMETGLYLTGWSKYLKSKPLAMPGQYEGYAYLGFGLIVLGIIALAGLLAQSRETLARWWSTRHLECIVAIITVAFLALASFGKQVTWNGSVLLNIPYPEFFLKIYGIFRSTGRFMWGVWDIIALAIVAIVYKTFSKKIIAMILCLICCFIQSSDLSPMTDNRHDLYAQRQNPYVSSIDSDQLNALLANKQHVMIYSAGNLPLRTYYDLAEAIIPKNITINDFYYSRRDSGAIEIYQQQEEDKLKAGNPDTQTLYVFDSYEHAERYQSNLHLYFVNGLIYGTVNPATGMMGLGKLDGKRTLRISNGQIIIPPDMLGKNLAIEINGHGAATLQWSLNGEPLFNNHLFVAHDSDSFLNGLLPNALGNINIDNIDSANLSVADISVTIYTVE